VKGETSKSPLPLLFIMNFRRDVKRGSSLWINQERFFPGQFVWQEGYGAFSYSRSQLDSVYQYIKNQPEHHRKYTFREEYLDFLKKFAIEYKMRLLFDFFDNLITPTG
jgi:putative transposase